ncbi:hypothetical protein LQW54_000896 [Pestalotiopsis sp. IQ-011]
MAPRYSESQPKFYVITYKKEDSLLDYPIEQWLSETHAALYPSKSEEYSPSPVPDDRLLSSGRYLRATLAKNERLRLSMLWYYTRDIFNESEFLCGLQEKLLLAQESTGWECVVIGLLDMDVYVRLATIGPPLAVLPRGETICAHTVTQPPRSVFLLPDLMEDWRFRNCPYVESGGLMAYGGVPLRLQNGDDEAVGLGSLCVCSTTSQPVLTKAQQSTLARLADWVVSDIIQCARAKRQRERRRMNELITATQSKLGESGFQDSVLDILRTTYPDAVISLQSAKASRIQLEGRDPISLSDIEDSLWEDSELLDDLIAKSNHKQLPRDRVVRLISAPFQGALGPSLLIVGSKDFRLVFDDVDLWFMQACADNLTANWHKRLLAEAVEVKDRFLRGFSHQLRTPVHGILGSAELLAEELSPCGVYNNARQASALLETTTPRSPGQPSIYIDTIMTAGRDLISIINNMITLNKWDNVAMGDRVYDAYSMRFLESELAKETHSATLNDALYSASIFFICDLQDDLESFETDISLLRDTLLPVITNSIQNTPTGGVVMVTANLRPDSKRLIIDIEDTGRGIHPDDQQRIFEPYEKVGVYSTGAGLGLTLASKFAALLNGSVNLVPSTPGNGTHFKIELQVLDFVRRSSPRQSLSETLEHLPAKFNYIPAGSEGGSLYPHFARFLTHQGFSAWDQTGDWFAILDFVSDETQRKEYLAQIPPGRVAICLIPTSNVDAATEMNSDNVVYATGPFLTSTLAAALEKTNALASKVKTSQSYLDHLDALCAASLSSKTLSTDESASSVDDASQANEQPMFSRTDSVGDLDLISHVPPTPRAVLPHRARSAETPGTYPTTPTANPTVLLVDDNGINLRIMQMYCKKRGLPHLCATNGQEAYDLFSKHQALCGESGEAPIELILMDLQMPICDGIDATKRIRSLETEMGWAASIVFMVTGQDSPMDRTDAQSAGADDYYVKPLSMGLLDCGVKSKFPAFKASKV